MKRRPRLPLQMPSIEAHAHILSGAQGQRLFSAHSPRRLPDDGLLPFQWQLVEPCAYILTVASGLWQQGNN